MHTIIQPDACLLNEVVVQQQQDAKIKLISLITFHVKNYLTIQLVPTLL